MNRDKYPMYGVAALVAAGIAVWAGVPAYFLLVLICPVMMFFMMASMSGGNARSDADATGGRPDSQKRTPAVDGSHDRIDQP